MYVVKVYAFKNVEEFLYSLDSATLWSLVSSKVSSSISLWDFLLAKLRLQNGDREGRGADSQKQKLQILTQEIELLLQEFIQFWNAFCCCVDSQEKSQVYFAQTSTQFSHGAL